MITAQRGLTAETLTGIVISTASGYVKACERAMVYFGVESSTPRIATAMDILVELSAPPAEP